MSRFWVLLGAMGYLGVAACATPAALPELEGGAEVAVQRGSAWTTLKVKPPYIIGPRTNLNLQKGTFKGSIDGRVVNLVVDGQSVHGMGPTGPVAYEIEETSDAVIIDGTWNGSRVHFKITDTSFAGTIPVIGSRSLATVQTCQYVLNAVQDDGARTGISTCAGLPEQTRIEVPGVVQTWLTRPELTVVLLALLSSPPTTAMEPAMF